MAELHPQGAFIRDWFNGGLFDGDDTLPLDADESKQLLALSRLDWSAIEPAIFGTLFERGLDPAKRSQLGAHYTDRASIMRLINPVIREPLLAEWEAVKTAIDKDKSKGRKKANQAYAGFLERLRNFRILDPACGSGNFLYLGLQTLKDLEHQAILEAEALGLQRQFPSVGPEAVHGLELNPYAAELARVTVWIGEIQWMIQHGYGHNTNPILKPLETIEQRDAILAKPKTDSVLETESVSLKLSVEEAAWPAADVIIGNPPFLGGSKLLGELGDEYTKALRDCYQGRVPGGADLVCYWFEKARAQIEVGKAQRAGLVATNSIRGGANRKVLERILSDTIKNNNANRGEQHVNSDFRHARISGKTQGGGFSARPSRSGGAGDCQSTGRIGDENAFGHHLRKDVSPDTHRLGRVEMDDGTVVSGRDLAGDENLFLTIFNAWSDEPWVNDGAAVRVSLICFGKQTENLPVSLDGKAVNAIYADLSANTEEASQTDLTQAQRLMENQGLSFQGSQKIGAFDIPGNLARVWLKLPNPHGKPNCDVLKPSWNGLDLVPPSA